MANSDDNKASIFQKVQMAANAYLDTQIFKAKSTILNSNVEDEVFFGKAVVEDPSYSLHSQGWLDKPYRVQNMHLKQMAYQDTAIAAVIQTRQNQVSQHSRLVKSKQQKGFMIEIKDEDALLAKIKEELKAEMKAKEQSGEVTSAEDESNIAKAEELNEEKVNVDSDDNNKSDDEVEAYDFELERKAKEKLLTQFEGARKRVEEYVQNCGLSKNRPHETLMWKFDSALRAMVRDALTYDLYAVETVPDGIGAPHHWFPVDGGTIRRASKELRKYKDASENFFNIDILYPEKEEAKAREEVIKLNPELLDAGAYKWVQVIRGKVERAYTHDELSVGIRNSNTDIYNNGYGISELEILVSMVTGHLNAEYYNQAYFTQGFSAKGILHIKAALNRRKVESVRTQWHHMLKGAKNSFQTPIFAGVEDVNWIPLTQNHNDIGFEGWMRYLVTMIGAIYQIDPAEMGIHFKAEGGGGSMGNRDNTDKKIENSKDRGLYPLLSHLETYITDNIIAPYDSRFKIVFTGSNGEDALQTLARQKDEVTFKKTVNEIRTEDGLPPLPGMDDIILDPQYMAWYNLYSNRALDKRKEERAQAEQDSKLNNPEEAKSPELDLYGEGAFGMNNSEYVEPEPVEEDVEKSIKIEYYNLNKK